ncbi:MAG: hypothetical protein ACK54L_19865, partial [Betaproteobacteria bacterium]
SNLYHRAHLYYFAPEPLAALAARAGLRAILLDGAPTLANLTAVFVKEAAAPVGAFASAHDAVVAANRARTLARYLTSGHTLASVAPRLWNRMQEGRIERAGGNGRAALDRLFATEAPRLGA